MSAHGPRRVTRRTPEGLSNYAARQNLIMLAFGLRDRAAAVFPPLFDVTFTFDPAAGTCRGNKCRGPTGELRARAYFQGPSRARAPVIGMAPALIHDEPENQAGVLLHELGHAVDTLCDRAEVESIVGPLGRGAEAKADIIGGWLAGQAHGLRYDPSTWIQTIGPGIGRPGHLPR